jgi:hypothetical protein
MPGSSKWSLSPRFPHKNPIYTSPLSHTCYTHHQSHSSWCCYMFRHDSFETCSSVIICEIIVHLLVTVRNNARCTVQRIEMVPKNSLEKVTAYGIISNDCPRKYYTL